MCEVYGFADLTQTVKRRSSRHSVVGVANVLRAGRFGVRILVEARDFSVLFKNFQIGSGQYPSQWAPVFFYEGRVAGT